MDSSFWNNMFDVEHYRYGHAPNAFLRDALHHLAPNSHILCLGDGEGRNGVFLASQGHHVTSVDQSSVALQKTKQFADKTGVSINLIQATLPSPDIPTAAFNAVVLIYLHLPSHVRTAIHHQAAQTLKPGGLLLLEAFTPRQLELARTSGGPKDRDALFSADLLRHDFQDLLDLQYLEECTVELDEGPGHQGTAEVVRLRAQRM